MKFICPLIVVESIDKSRFLYEELLGQNVKTDFGENITFHGDFAIHERKHFEKLIKNKVKQKSNSFELYFEEDDLEEIESILKEHDFEFVHGILEQPWKQKVLRFYDYDKNIIEIGERLEHVAYRLSNENLSIEEISKITYLTVETVKKSISEYSKE